MTNNIKTTLLAATLAATASCNTTSASSTAAPASTSGHVVLHGVDYHYEIHGAGAPLVLLHGGLMSSESFTPLLPTLGEGRQVITIDLQGHGRTTLGDRPITLVDSANDVDALLEKIGVPHADVLGYSFGGCIALRLAIQHPQRVNKLVVLSAPYAQDGFYPEMLPQQAAVGAAMLPMMKQSPMYQQYVAVAPKPDDFGRLLDRMGEWMRTPYNYADEVKTIKAPTLLVYGDSDMIRLEHITEFYKLLGGAQQDAGWQREHIAKNRLAILSNVTHYEMLNAPLLVPTVRSFLETK